jgi:tetratricopeptide (TPR) repeat protein
MKRMRATSPSAARFISFGSLAMVGMFAMWPSTVLAQVPAPKTGGPEAGDPKSGDPKSGDPKSGDPEAADPKAADPKPEERPSGPPKAGPLPSGPSKEILDRVAALEKEATAISKHKDWLTVADLLEQAYFLVSDPDLAYRIGEAAREGKDCVRAGVYYREFLDAAEFAEPAQVQNAQKRLNQLDTFECPARTPEDDAAMAETLVRHAKQLADEKDFLGSAIEYARATELDPKRPLLAYEVGVASWNAHACSDAVSWFFHFRDLPEAKAHAKEIKQSSKYIDDSELGKCAQWTEQARSDHALLLYEQGQNLEFARDYLGAAGKYERAYEILPSNIVLAFRAAEMSWSPSPTTGRSSRMRPMLATIRRGRRASRSSRASMRTAVPPRCGRPKGARRSMGGTMNRAPDPVEVGASRVLRRSKVGAVARSRARSMTRVAVGAG